VNESSKLKEFMNDSSDDEDAVNESTSAVLVNESSKLKEFVNRE
jgi:hypothetical protein